MKGITFVRSWRALAVLITTFLAPSSFPAEKPGFEQVPKWSAQDLEFFRHGSMSTEVIPEAVLRAFIKTYPDLFPTSDFSHLGLVPDPEFGWPVGLSRTPVKHLAGLPAVGINCASCHYVQIAGGAATTPIQILGGTSHFDVEAFFGSVLVATFRTSDPANMKKFLPAFLAETDPGKIANFETAWKQEEEPILAMMTEDPFGAKNVRPGELHDLSPADLKFHTGIDRPVATLSHYLLQLFHNMRAALHVPDQPPEKPPPVSGPGRNDAFGLLSAALLNAPQPYAPTKFGLVWNVGKRHWVHWDGNTNSPLARNLLASLGLGAPLHGNRGELDFATIKRQTDLSEDIQAPRYPFAVDQAAAKRGSAHFQTACASCHGGPESDRRLYSLSEIGTDPNRAQFFNQGQADGFNKFLAEFEALGYEPPKEIGVRSTGKYWAATLTGAWARAPYLHNGSVRTMQELLTKPEERAKSFHRGSRAYDDRCMGYTDEGLYVLDTSAPGNSNAGHNYGTNLSPAEKQDLMEYLKTL